MAMTKRTLQQPLRKQLVKLVALVVVVKLGCHCWVVLQVREEQQVQEEQVQEELQEATWPVVVVNQRHQTHDAILRHWMLHLLRHALLEALPLGPEGVLMQASSTKDEEVADGCLEAVGL
jgi:hypothetical protein